ARRRLQPARRSRDGAAARRRLRAPPRAAPSDAEPARTRVNSVGSLEGDAPVRLFCALRLPDDVLDGLVEWGRRELPERRGLRRVVRGNLHVTLAFLGRRSAAELPAIGGALRHAAAEA